MADTHNILVMMVDDNGAARGLYGELEFRFVPRIGEHLILPVDHVTRDEDKGFNAFEVVDVQYDNRGAMELWVIDRGEHLEHRAKVSRSG